MKARLRVAERENPCRSWIKRNRVVEHLAGWNQRRRWVRKKLDLVERGVKRSVVARNAGGIGIGIVYDAG